ncbi:hypothetical protein ACFYZ4_32645 [Streptomyces sp. NPDC001513]
MRTWQLAGSASRLTIRAAVFTGSRCLPPARCSSRRIDGAPVFS